MTISGILKVAVVIGAVALLPLAACGGSDEKTSIGDTVTRAASGDLTANGGARRLDGDQSEAIREAIGASGAKNVILLIGDGMGDSEITVARNYEKGAGRVLHRPRRVPAHRPVHDVRAGQGWQAELRHRLGGQRHGMVDGDQDLQRRARHRHQGQPPEDDPRAGQGAGLRDRRHHHLRDPGRHACRALLSHHRTRLLRPQGDRQGLHQGSSRERWTRVGHRAVADHPPRHHRWAAAPRPSLRRRTAANTRARPSRSRPRNAASK